MLIKKQKSIQRMEWEEKLSDKNLSTSSHGDDQN